jgi:hypothetical protein
MYIDGKDVWFRAKRYGWGWGWPCAWQGWLVALAYVAAFTAAGIILRPTERMDLFIGMAILLSLAFLVICAMKGETARWRWGDDTTEQSRTAAERLSELDELRRRRLISESEFQHRREEIPKGL